MPPQVETGNPTSEGRQPPCKGKELLAAEFISSGSKDTLLCSVEHKIRLMTGRKRAGLYIFQWYPFTFSGDIRSLFVQKRLGRCKINGSVIFFSVW